MEASRERAALEREVELEFFRSGGPGGQHRNKVETGVRLRHRASGIVVTATERRSQAQNRALAFERLAERLAAARRVAKRRVKTKKTRGAERERLETKKKRSLRKRERGGGWD